ncbi:MAG: hypothetical protein KIT58_05475 [Planctomycetota bacterium]|nr:hypothetical protein [Planctomycetota bacterium]
MAEPAEALDLEPGERVLWEGRPGFGAPWHEVRQVLRTALAVWAALVAIWLFPALLGALGTALADGRLLAALTLLLISFVFNAVMWGLFVTPIALAFVLARVVGPYHVSLIALCVFGPIFALGWAGLVASHGWEGALARTGAESFVCAGVFLGLPLLRIAAGVIKRLNLVYVLTDRRAAAVHTGGADPHLLWTAPLVHRGRLQARVVWPWRSRRRGHLAFGFGRERRDVAMIERPDEVLALVRHALGEAVEGVVPRRRPRRSRDAAEETEVDAETETRAESAAESAEETEIDAETETGAESGAGADGAADPDGQGEGQAR